MRRLATVLWVGLLAAAFAPVAAIADINLMVSPDIPSATPSNVYSVELYMQIDIGTQTDNLTWSVGCDSSCTLQTFVFNEAYAPGSGQVTWADGVTRPPAAGGLPILNTSGSISGSGDGLGTVIGDGSYVGSIGPQLTGVPISGGGNTYLIGTLTVHLDSPEAVVTPFFRLGEGAFNQASSVPTNFSSATLGVPEPGTAALLAMGLGGLALAGRRNRS